MMPSHAHSHEGMPYRHPESLDTIGDFGKQGGQISSDERNPPSKGHRGNLDGAAYGLAAFSLCQSMVLAVTEAGAVSAEELYGAVEDAIDAHRQISGEQAALHRDAARLLERFLNDLNAITPPKGPAAQ